MATKTTKNNKEVESKDEKKVKTHPLIIGTRITEKAAINAERGAYTFNVKNNANKSEIKKAIKLLYNVTPVKVSIVKIADKPIYRRGIPGVKSGGKKAVVYLKDGDKIAFA